MTPAQRRSMTRFVGLMLSAVAAHMPLLVVGSNVKPLPPWKALAELSRPDAFPAEGLRRPAADRQRGKLIQKARQGGDHDRAQKLIGELLRDLDRGATAPMLFDLRRFFWLMASATRSHKNFLAGDRDTLLREARWCIRRAVECCPLTPTAAGQLAPFVAAAEDKGLHEDLQCYLREGKLLQTSVRK
jgi:hypothetical protein